MVTFTLPAELRGLFFGPDAKTAHDAFFAASSRALSEKLADPKWLGAVNSGFTGVLHTWNQRLQFHPHIHYIVPGAGLDADGGYLGVKNANFLVPVGPLSGAFRSHMRALLDALGWECDPDLWHRNWGVHVQPFGSGGNAIRYLGASVCRTAIGDSRILAADEHTVTFTWKDRENGGRVRPETLAGTEFVKRHLRHVLPRGMRSIRYFGFCHPSAKARRERVAFHSGMPLLVGSAADDTPPAETRAPVCPCCKIPMKLMRRIRPSWRSVPRPPPRPATAGT